MPVRRTFWERCESEDASLAECRHMVGETSVVKYLVDDSQQRRYIEDTIESLVTGLE